MVVPTPKESWCHRWLSAPSRPQKRCRRVEARCPVACHQRFLCGSLQWIDLGGYSPWDQILTGFTWFGLAGVFCKKNGASRSVLVEWFIKIFYRRLPPYVWLMHICPSLTAHLCVVKPTLRVIGDRKRESLPGPPQFPRHFKQIPAAATERRLWTKKT